MVQAKGRHSPCLAKEELMIIATWNVNSLTVRLEQLLDWMKDNKPNIICLQETKSVDEKFPGDRFESLGYHCEFFGEKTYNGVAIISDKPLGNIQKGFVGESPSSAKRLIGAEVDDIKILNTYIPNGQAVGSEKFFYKLNWLKSLNEHIEKAHKPAEPIIWCGDFNVAPEDIDIYDSLAMAGQIMRSEEERVALNGIRDWGFIDAYRLKEKGAGNFSWWDYRMGAFRRNMGFRIDHIWVTRPLADRCVRSWIDKAPRKLERPSDHAPVVAEFAD